MNYIVGVDIGGTKMALVKANSAGRILCKKTIPTKVGKAALQSINGLLAAIASFGSDSKRQDRLIGIGFGIPGSVSEQEGVISVSPNLPGWAGIPIKKILEKEFRVPVFLDNDANVACFAEKIFGQGKKHRAFLYVTVSTGIGAGIFVNDAMLHGANGYAGEIGHLVVHPGGRRCNCGKRGCLEAHASGTAIAKIAREYVTSLSPSGQRRSAILRCAGGKRSSIDAQAVEAAARQGDRSAQRIFAVMGYDLGLGFSSVIQTLNPEAIILGGSVTKAWPFFAPAMKKAIKENVWNSLSHVCTITRTKLGDLVTDLGAVALVLNNLK